MRWVSATFAPMKILPLVILIILLVSVGRAGAQVASYPLADITVTSDYGYRKDPFTGERAFHSGVDLRANYEAVYAMLLGEVEKVGKDKNAGRYVTLRHGNTTVSYCHLSATSVEKGDKVDAGTIIGMSGSSGRSTAPHLHLCVKYKNRPINPMSLLELVGKNL